MRTPIPEEFITLTHHQLCMAFEEYQNAQILKGASPEVVSKMQETLDGMNSEFANGVSIQGEYVVTIGRRVV